MANLPKCTECEYNNLMEVTCRLYPTGIPDDIFVEIKKCDYYKKRKEKYNKSVCRAWGSNCWSCYFRSSSVLQFYDY